MAPQRGQKVFPGWPKVAVAPSWTSPETPPFSHIDNRQDSDTDTSAIGAK